jgi:hypothetical protein
MCKQPLSPEYNIAILYKPRTAIVQIIMFAYDTEHLFLLVRVMYYHDISMTLCVLLLCFVHDLNVLDIPGKMFNTFKAHHTPDGYNAQV